MHSEQKGYKIPDVTLAVFFQWINVTMVIVNVGLGMSIFAGGNARFPRPSYNPLIEYAQGRIWVWGVLILIAGILMSIPFKYLNIIGLWVSMVWHIVWASCFTVAVTQSPTSAATAIPAYSGFALISFALLTEKVLERKVVDSG